MVKQLLHEDRSVDCAKCLLLKIGVMDSTQIHKCLDCCRDDFCLYSDNNKLCSAYSAADPNLAL